MTCRELTTPSPYLGPPGGKGAPGTVLEVLERERGQPGLREVLEGGSFLLTPGGGVPVSLGPGESPGAGTWAQSRGRLPLGSLGGSLLSPAPGGALGGFMATGSGSGHALHGRGEGSWWLHGGEIAACA